ncbi:MAG TPA: DUF4142 domain-containing protein [Aliidongia sp.]|nr:DUF4142 domain-containing protein [Aliidongia sp.]
MSKLISLAAVLALYAGAASAQTADSASGGPAQLNAMDRQFVTKATIGGMTEVQESQLAQGQAQSDDVKSFGQHMVTDHVAAGEKLKSIVAAEGIQAPADLDKKHQQELSSLEKLKGGAFDKRYVKAQLAAHKQTVALFEKEASSGQDPQLKQFASATLPTLKEHLSDVEGLAKQ